MVIKCREAREVKPSSKISEVTTVKIVVCSHLHLFLVFRYKYAFKMVNLYGVMQIPLPSFSTIEQGLLTLQYVSL